MNTFINTWIVFFVIVIVSFFIFWHKNTSTTPSYSYTEAATLGNTKLSIARVTSPIGWTKGLSGQKTLQSSEGLLFVFYIPGTYGIWMKDMNFPIDVFWLDKDGVVVTIKKNFSPDSYPESVLPSSKSLYVLETVAGLADKEHIEIGDKLNFLETGRS